MKNSRFYLMFTIPMSLMFLCLVNMSMGQQVVDRIPLKPGPEDMVLDTLSGEPALLISCCERREINTSYGEIVRYYLRTGAQEVVDRRNEPEDILFRPHGIYLDGNLLYVISHEREPDYHPILVYRVYKDHLDFKELIHAGGQHSPNALVTGPGREIYLVNDSGKRGSVLEKALKLKRASVEKLSKRSDGLWRSELVVDKLGYPAGINRIGDQLYVGDALLHKIHVYRIKREGLSPVGEISKLKGNDNIRIYNGQLLTPGHVKPFRFIAHARNPKKLSPVDVFLADPATGEISILYSNDGSAISAGSTAIIYQNQLYICQVFEPFILKVELDQ
jgi:hypothetical protein